MIRAVLDTNVLVSSFLQPQGVPGHIRKAWENQRFQVCLSIPLFAEWVEVLHRPVIRSATRVEVDEITGFLDLLPKVATLFTKSLPDVRVIEADPDDDVAIATAVATHADVIVSGDRHLLDLGSYEGIAIVSPRSFLEILRSEG